jgi:multidrug efflux pump subunit AcrA (membrane-fusion protein)
VAGVAVRLDDDLEDPQGGQPAVPPRTGAGRDRRSARRERRRLLIGTAVLVVLLAAAGVWWATRPSSAATTAPIRAVAAAVGTLRMTTATSGTLAPAQQADLSFQVSGEVTSVPATVGEQVKAGQTLATVSSAGLAAQVAQAKASLAQAQARLSADASASSSQRDADQQAVTAAQSALTNVKAGLDQATLTSPIAGTVAQVDLTVGQQVSAGSGGSSGTTGAAGSGSTSGGAGGAGTSSGAGSSSGAGTSSGAAAGSAAAAGSGGASSAQVVVIGSGFVVDATVDDTQIGLVKDGEQAVIVPQGSSTPVYGTVTSVGLLGSSTSGVASFPVVISVTGTPTGLFSGAAASVSVVYRQLSDVLEVPTTAIHYAGGSAYVELAGAEGSTGTRTTVGVGASSAGVTQITSGLSEGQQVLVPAARTGAGGAGPSPSGRSGQTGTGRTGGFGGGFGGGLGGGLGGGFGGGQRGSGGGAGGAGNAGAGSGG